MPIMAQEGSSSLERDTSHINPPPTTDEARETLDFSARTLAAMTDFTGTLERLAAVLTDLITGEPYSHTAPSVPKSIDRSSLVHKLFAIINERGGPQVPGSRTYDYEQKYPRDDSYKEAGPEARVWKVYLDESDIHDKERLYAFQDTLNVLLVFIGLFSAIVTAFVIEASRHLEPDFAEVSSFLLLEMVSLQRAVANGTSVTTVPFSSRSPDGPFTPDPVDVWVNALWYTSLILSLCAALVAVLAKQWLQYYSSVISGSNPRDHCRIRQFRLDGLETWHVNGIIGLLPTVLLASLASFLAGLVIFLFQLHRGIGIAAAVITGSLYCLYILSVALSILVPGCPYKGPIPHYLFLGISSTLTRFRLAVKWAVRRLFSPLKDVSGTWGKILSYLHQPQPPLIHSLLNWASSETTPAFASLQTLEAASVKAACNEIDINSLTWLYHATGNTNISRIALQSFGGLGPPFSFHPTNLTSRFNAIRDITLRDLRHGHTSADDSSASLELRAAVLLNHDRLNARERQSVYRMFGDIHPSTVEVNASLPSFVWFLLTSDIIRFENLAFLSEYVRLFPLHEHIRLLSSSQSSESSNSGTLLDVARSHPDMCRQMLGGFLKGCHIPYHDSPINIIAALFRLLFKSLANAKPVARRRSASPSWRLTRQLLLQWHNMVLTSTELRIPLLESLEDIICDGLLATNLISGHDLLRLSDLLLTLQWCPKPKAMRELMKHAGRAVKDHNLQHLPFRENVLQIAKIAIDEAVDLDHWIQPRAFIISDNSDLFLNLISLPPMRIGLQARYDRRYLDHLQSFVTELISTVKKGSKWAKYMSKDDVLFDLCKILLLGPEKNEKAFESLLNLVPYSKPWKQTVPKIVHLEYEKDFMACAEGSKQDVASRLNDAQTVINIRIAERERRSFWPIGRRKNVQDPQLSALPPTEDTPDSADWHELQQLSNVVLNNILQPESFLEVLRHNAYILPPGTSLHTVDPEEIQRGAYILQPNPGYVSTGTVELETSFGAVDRAKSFESRVEEGMESRLDSSAYDVRSMNISEENLRSFRSPREQNDQ